MKKIAILFFILFPNIIFGYSVSGVGTATLTINYDGYYAHYNITDGILTDQIGAGSPSSHNITASNWTVSWGYDATDILMPIHRNTSASCSGKTYIECYSVSGNAIIGNTWGYNLSGGVWVAVPEPEEEPPPEETATSTIATGNIEFGLAIIITILSVGVTSVVWRALYQNSRKPWQK